MPEPPTTSMAGDLPFVSVIIPVYNGAATIGDCLESLLGMDYPRDRFEVIVVDNGSTDATGDTLARYDGRIRRLHEPRRGAGAARNRGIREATGAVVAFTDADAVVDPGWLADLVPRVAQPGTGAVGGPILSRQPANRIEQFGERIHDQRFAIEECRPPYLASGNWASPRDVLCQVGLFDEHMMRGQDADLALRLHHAGYRLAYSPDAIVYHRNEGTITGLWHEGWTHGIAGVRIRDKQAATFPGMRRQSGAGRRLLRHAGHLLRGGDRFTSALHIVFESGKLGGELFAVARWRREHTAAAPPHGSASR